MTISTFGGLKTALGDWTANPTLAGWLPDFITIAETVFNYGEGDDPGSPAYIAPLRARQMEASTTLTTDANYNAPLPADYLETRRVQNTSATPGTMSYVTPEWFSENYPNGDTGDYSFYTILGSNLIAGESVSFDYYQLIPTIVGQPAGDNATNWLLAAAPNAYLFGGLYAAAVFMKDADKAAGYRGLMLAATGGFRRTAALQRADRPTMRASMTAF